MPMNLEDAMTIFATKVTELALAAMDGTSVKRRSAEYEVKRRLVAYGHTPAEAEEIIAAWILDQDPVTVLKLS